MFILQTRTRGAGQFEYIYQAFPIRTAMRRFLGLLCPAKGILQDGVVATGSPDWKYVWERLTKGTAAFVDP